MNIRTRISNEDQLSMW